MRSIPQDNSFSYSMYLLDDSLLFLLRQAVVELLQVLHPNLAIIAPFLLSQGLVARYLKVV